MAPCPPHVSFPPYRPPLGLAGGHRQTVAASLFRQVPGAAYRRERLELPDGDFLDLDWSLAGPSRADRVAVIAHGLEGSTQRRYVRGMARALSRRGWDALAWNLRGCSGEPNRLLRAYHSGATGDLDAVVQRAFSGGYASVGLVGFSLGGNLTLRWVGEQGAGIDARISGAVGVSVPVDLAASSVVMARWSRRPYMTRFLRSLAEKGSEKAARFPDAPDPAAYRGMRTFREFDGHFTAPVHGFESAEDYWRRASALPVLSRVHVPTLLVNALDDPFLAPTCFPEAVAAANPCFRLLAPPRGGHVGFLQGRPTTWAEDVAGIWLDAALAARNRGTAAP